MRILFAFALLASTALAHATDWDLPPASMPLEGCDASADAGLAACADKALEKADADLNAVWKKVLVTFDPKSAAGNSGDVTPAQLAEWKADLVAAQQAWVTFKDKDCNGARGYEYWGGSGRGIAVTSCLYEYTVNRAADLRTRYLDD